ncbi:MAG: rRNA pseudouridine516 synthase [Pseudomonadota bacterium]|nr:rRNA pseudouridine516 synthase [Pseudomonadota bacterium]MDQ5880208.1 rRNA pseudouridine516 synthase [Pseudomonadota bacterium]MDQ5915444.1 rRNA pseudouridine516 synthase [Pseudomonadota bacterium]MDQ5918463.1 rRNA pseudouridine516 synthase [Pseudomonadota bacterium]MDQ5942958.1 rRNA pseudouridine516 synthase [Pseudomonadota bacterium]
MQLERILHTQGFGSRKECRALIRNGRISIAGEEIDDPFVDLEPNGLSFSFDGEIWIYHPQAYVMLNKPAGYECSHQPKHHASIYSLLPPPLNGRGVQSLGRLDEDTTGLLLFSDDGKFIHAISSGKRKVPKTYRVTAKHAVSDEQMATLLAGVQLVDEPAPIFAAGCERMSENEILLTVTEGRYHQVKRMVAGVGNRVEALCRVAVGGLLLPEDLAPGQWRWLSNEDLAQLLGITAGT